MMKRKKISSKEGIDATVKPELNEYFVLLTGYVIKSAYVECDMQFLESKWGAYLVEMYEEYLRVANRKGGIQDVRDKLGAHSG